MTNFCWPILLADIIGQLYRSSDIPLTHYLLQCSFICLVVFLARLHKKLQADLAEIFRDGFTCPNLVVIRFWW